MIEAAPIYVCHKEVRALKIAEVLDRGTDTTTDENPIVEVRFENDMFEPVVCSLRGKPTPQAGWYLVSYPDGYFSFSPEKSFEDGYTLKA